jgi:excisionase family DNA binding protein
VGFAEASLLAGKVRGVQEQTDAPLSPLLTVPQAAECLDMSVRWTWERVRAGEIPCVALGRRRKIRRQDLEAFVEQHLQPARVIE